MPRTITTELSRAGVRWHATESLRDAFEDADVAYVTRIQAERFEDPTEAARYVGNYVVNLALLESIGRTDITLLHPLPRHGDLSADLDHLPGAAWFRQSHYGVPIRMAMFCALFGVEPTPAYPIEPPTPSPQPAP